MKIRSLGHIGHRSRRTISSLVTRRDARLVRRPELHCLRRSRNTTRPRVNFHSLRKNFVTTLDKTDGVSQADVAAIVGHERDVASKR